jgi:uncharacterized protein YbaR (Trm112 family)
MSNLVVRRRLLEESLQGELPPNFITASGPDHPLLLRGPDLLVGGEGIMTAVYTPSAVERQNPAHLKNRFVLARLALPVHTRHVLVAESAADRTLGQEFADDFDAVEDFRSRAILASLAQDKNFAGSRSKLPPEVVLASRQQFADVMQLTRVMRKLDERLLHPYGEVVRSERLHRTRARRQKTMLKDGIALSVFGAGPVSPTSVQALVNEQVNRSFRLDNGIPRFTAESTYGIALVEDLPLFPGDPEKLLRAAAFAGWAMVAEVHQQELPELISNLAERRKKRV